MKSILFADKSELIFYVCEYKDVSVDDLLSSSRKASIVRARYLVAYVLLYAGHTMEDIGKMMNRDRSSIHYYKRVLTDDLDFIIKKELIGLRRHFAEKDLLLPNLGQFKQMLRQYNLM